MKQKYLLLGIAAALCMPVMADTWRPLGNATVIDGWITPGYVDDNGVQLNPASSPFEVPVEESVENPGMYKLINPFASSDFYLSEFNLDGTPSDIVIDARDRTFVIIQPQYCGFTDADPYESTGKYPYFLSDMGTYMYNLGQQREVINLLKCASTMTGNIIYIPQPTFGTTAGHAIEAWETSYPSYIILPEESDDDAEMWESMGTATVTDGWLMPGWTDENDNHYVVADHPFACEVQMNTENPNLICLVNPFRMSEYPLSVYNLSGRDTRLIIDITDPDFVKIEMQFSGFIGRQDNDIVTYYVTEGGHYLLANGRTEAEIKAAGHNATYKDGVINIPTPLFAFSATGSAQQWKAPQAAKIVIDGAGIGSVEADASDAPVEYFNLQGVRIANPSAGQLYIRRQGTDVKKIIL